MANSTRARQVHLVVGRPWKDALISFLAPRSPYRAWVTGSTLSPGDIVIAALDTTPRTVLTTARVGPDADVTGALAGVDRNRARGLMDGDDLQLANLSDYRDPARLAPATARCCIEAIGDSIVEGHLDRRGHGSARAARVLLESRGICTGCDLPLPLGDDDARDRIHIRTVDEDTPPDADWPATLCIPCRTAMAGFGTFCDYRLTRNGRCPRCWQRMTCEKIGDMVDDFTYQNLPPWQVVMGLGEPPTRWYCANCHHEW